MRKIVKFNNNNKRLIQALNKISDKFKLNWYIPGN